MELNIEQIYELLETLNSRLAQKEIQVRMNMYGGAVMCLEYAARQSTKDIDAIFSDTKSVYMEAYKIASEFGVNPEWLNDAIHIIKDKLKKESLRKVIRYSNIDLFVPSAEQMFAMKAYAARPFPYKDYEDLTFLFNYLKIKSKKKAMQIVYKYFDKKLIERKTINLINMICKELDLK
jgi:hypothetical protein